MNGLFSRGVARGPRLLLCCALVLVAQGCRGGEETHAPPAPKPTGSNSKAISTLVSTSPPNELGRVPILEYHEIGAPEGRWRRTPENFRQDLEWLYAHGFRAVSLQDYVTGNLCLPRGASPVVLTFDDAHPTQFRYAEKNGQPVVDPNCAVGILEAFCRKHPDFGLKATFYVLPHPFGQARYVRQKLQYLVSQGMELGNHTFRHANLKRLSRAQVQEELAKAQQAVQEAVPGYRFFSLALPYGIAPRERSLAVQGASNGVAYHHQAILLVGSTPAPSPYDKAFDPLQIERVQATDSTEVPEYLRLKAQLKKLVEVPGRRYVSDGDPNTITVPASRKSDVALERVQGKRMVVR